MTFIRKSVSTALALAVLSAAASFVPVSQANAGGYGYYNQGNGYYQSCRKVRERYWDGYRWRWHWVERCH